MTTQEIKDALAAGKKVYWHNSAYEVIKDSKDQYLIRHTNGSCIGVTWADGETLNGKEEQFYTLN